MLIDWTDRAKIHLRGIVEYIAQDNPAAAYRVHGDIQQQTARLADYPKLGRVGRVKGTRELVINRTPYIVAYQIKSDTVQILAVLHGAQDWNKQFPD